MDKSALEDKIMIQYLLGQLSEDERLRVEESFFEDNGTFEHLMLLEDDLIDDYVNGRLEFEPQKAFQKKMRSDPRWRQRVVFAEALADRIRATTEQVRPARSESFFEILTRSFRAWKPGYQFATAGAALAVVVGVLWLSSEMLDQRARVQSLQAERQNLQKTLDDLQGQVAGLQQQGQSLSTELEQERLKRQELESRRPGSSGSLGLVASLVLTAGLVRGPGDSAQLTLPPGASAARLQMQLDPAEDYSSYRANLRTASGDLRQSAEGLRPRTAGGAVSVTMEVPARRLTAGNYELELLGLAKAGNLEEVAYYYFTVK